MDLLGFTKYDDWILPFLIVLTIIVFVHEWGHYWIAKKNGVRVEVFSIGFGPELFGWYDKSGTRWKVSLIPLGGYVKMFGMVEDDEDEDVDPQELSDDEKAVSFAHKTVGQRAAIVAGGPAANFIFAIIVLAAVAMTSGLPQIQVVVGEILPDSAASQSQLSEGDVIVALNGAEVENSRDVQRIIAANPGRTVAMQVSRK